MQSGRGVGGSIAQGIVTRLPGELQPLSSPVSFRRGHHTRLATVRAVD